MRRLLIAMAAASVALSACGTTGQLPGPSALADRTTLDEKLGLTFTLGYTAAARAAALAITSGLVKDQATIARIGRLDNQLYAAVMKVRGLYLAGNAATYQAAVDQANSLLAQLTAASGARVSSNPASPALAASVARQLETHRLLVTHQLAAA